MTSVFGGPRSSRNSVHYPDQPAYHATSRGAPSVVYNDSRSEIRDPRIPRSSSRRHSVSSQPRPIVVPHSRDRSPQPPSGGRSSVDRFGGARSSVDRFGGPRSSADFGRGGGGHSPPGRRNSIHISDSTGGPRHSTASLRRHDDRGDHGRDERTRPGTTRFPRKFVNRDAVEEAGWPFEEDRETGAIVVFKALSKKEIDTLVERTSYIRKLRAEGGPQRSTNTAPVPISAHSHKTRPTTPSRLMEDRDKHVAFSPERTTIIHQTDAPPKSISQVVPVATRHVSENKRDEDMEELSRKAKSEMEARMRAEEVARSVRSESAPNPVRNYGGSGRRLGRDVVVVR